MRHSLGLVSLVSILLLAGCKSDEEKAQAAVDNGNNKIAQLNSISLSLSAKGIHLSQSNPLPAHLSMTELQTAQTELQDYVRLATDVLNIAARDDVYLPNESLLRGYRVQAQVYLDLIPAALVRAQEREEGPLPEFQRQERLLIEEVQTTRSQMQEVATQLAGENIYVGAEDGSALEELSRRSIELTAETRRMRPIRQLRESLENYILLAETALEQMQSLSRWGRQQVFLDRRDYREHLQDTQDSLTKAIRYRDYLNALAPEQREVGN